MAAYAATVTLDFPTANRVGNTALGLVMGTCNITNYNTTQAELTAITKKFRPSGKLRVVGSMSSGGYVTRWNSTSLAFEAWMSDSVDGGVLVESGDDTVVGTFDFIAIGQL